MAAATSAESSGVRSRRSCRPFFHPQRPASAPPAGAGHPGGRQGRGRRELRGRRSSLPPRKVGPGAPRVDARGRTQVLSEVEQHVDHARARLPRRRERAGVIPIADHLPSAAEQSIDRQGQSDREPVHAAAGAARLISLDDEVTVILLDREMDHSKAIDRRPGDGTPERAEQSGGAKRRQPRRRSDGELHRIPRVDLGSCDVRHRRSAARLPSGPFPSPAPRSHRCQGQPQPHLPSWSRLDSAHVPSSAREAPSCVLREGFAGRAS